jgi:hypothetical protein
VAYSILLSRKSCTTPSSAFSHRYILGYFPKIASAWTLRSPSSTHPSMLPLWEQAKYPILGVFPTTERASGIYAIPDEESMRKVLRIRVLTPERWRQKIVAKSPAAELNLDKEMLQIASTRYSALSTRGYASTLYIRKLIPGDGITRGSVASGRVREPLCFLSDNQCITRRRNSAESCCKYFIFISNTYKPIWRPQGESTLSPGYGPPQKHYISNSISMSCIYGL